MKNQTAGRIMNTYQLWTGLARSPTKKNSFTVLAKKTVPKCGE